MINIQPSLRVIVSKRFECAWIEIIGEKAVKSSLAQTFGNLLNTCE